MGFIFGTSATVKPHIEHMLQKARRKLWTLRHVKKSGFGTEDLLKVFNTIVRSTLEYAVPTYHPMLTGELRDSIERIQKQACKIIFGWDSDYDTLVSSGRIESLDSRREKLTLNFAKKAAQDPRFEHWFPVKDYGSLQLRRERKYEEYYARTERLMKSPLFYMRRALNNANAE